MARCSLQMPEDFLKKISKLEDKTDEIIPKVLKEGGKVVESRVKSNLQAVLGQELKEKPRSTGELINALGVSPAGIDKNGNYDVKVGFDEPRRDGESNAKIANIIEYGKSGQPPKPFLKPAQSSSKRACIETMKRKLDAEINKL